MIHRRRMAAVALAATAALAAAGCGAGRASPSAGARPQRPLTHVTLRLGWLVDGSDGAFVAASHQGFYRKVGLSVKVEEGRSSTLTASEVADGKNTFGIVADTDVPLLVAKGAKIKSVATYFQLSPSGMIHSPGVHIDRPQDLKGRTILANSSAGPSAYLFLTVLRKGGLTRKDVNYQIVSAPTEVSTFATHPRDILLGWGNSTYASVLKVDPRARFTPDSKFGANVLSSAIVTTPSEIRNHPGVVRGFVTASMKGWRYMRAHPKRTVGEILHDFPNANRFMLSKSLTLSLPLAHTPATRGKPLGWAAASDWKQTVDFLHRYAGLKVIRPLSDYYTNRYVQ